MMLVQELDRNLFISLLSDSFSPHAASSLFEFLEAEPLYDRGMDSDCFHRVVDLNRIRKEWKEFESIEDAYAFLEEDPFHRRCEACVDCRNGHVLVKLLVL